MAQSKCGKCDNSLFEIKENSPNGARFKYYFIQCVKCGNVVSSTDYSHVPGEIKSLKQDIDNINRNVKSLENKLNFLIDGMERILRNNR